MASIERGNHRETKRCPVCGSHRCGIIRRMDPGALPVTRVFYGCGSIVTAAGTSLNFVGGIDCRRRKTHKV